MAKISCCDGISLTCTKSRLRYLISFGHKLKELLSLLSVMNNWYCLQKIAEIEIELSILEKCILHSHVGSYYIVMKFFILSCMK